MQTDINEVEINGVTYTRKDTKAQEPAETVDGLKYVIVRTYSAGVFAGYLEKREGKEVVLRNPATATAAATAATALNEQISRHHSMPRLQSSPSQLSSSRLSNMWLSCPNIH